MNAKALEPIRLRGHTLLCLQGFRGEGYDAVFVDRLTEIHNRLADRPHHLVKVVQAPDDLCAFCPNLQAAGCQLKGPDSEAEMRAQDQAVMARLAIAPGTVLSWNEILSRIGRDMKSEDLKSICGTCRWLPLGYCQEGIVALNRRCA